MTETFEVGEKVRFRLGERMPQVMPCCGETLDYWDYLLEYSGEIFTIRGWCPTVCPFCRSINPDDEKTVTLDAAFFVEGSYYSGISVYPQEIERITGR